MVEAKAAKPRKATSAEQELIEELEVAKLRKQIGRLKKLPKDFRDMEVMNKDWRDFAEIMGSEKKAEMLEWAKGGVLCVVSINSMERRVLQGFGEVHVIDPPTPPLANILLQMTTQDLSFVYASSWPRVAISGLNWLASDYGWNFRFMGQLLGGNGNPLGI
ncbi:hypothetical protein LCGC14_0752930 [marine sediment metagenome]|uniref:Uncharacterized protein n=1 Tax=marine sediment metagenome TaxID=412755 RepID=A0A0F9Q7P2_9ZZZZ